MVAAALAARVRWRTPFESYSRRGGVASDEPGQQWLRQLSGRSVDRCGPRRHGGVVVEGDGDVDVHLLLGDQQPADVLAAGLRELSGEARASARPPTSTMVRPD